ncbi:class I SAM-dependent methyltransferase [Anaerocolumna chitinilytica]|uniref:Methyltransferase n=1 Tax=Anaerocolumna chitinilytica TaxID=1727145 RepID=A0A7M3S9D9_9FIRM|nr:class I SAM-dependent methyltransferase [Anaerocolumna chitinilytica]BCK01207.1 methyltransferase [Anaerocolumna chitinilytica]
MSVSAIKCCRVCDNHNMELVLDLGIQELTGVFPKNKDEKITEGPLQLLFCPKCGLLQLAHSYELGEMYGENYGYRSGLNQSMVAHLSSKAKRLSSQYGLIAGDIVLDIGSNDGTTLNAYSVQGLTKIGMDPTGVKFNQYYKPDVRLISDFFSADKFLEESENKRAKVVTSISMFYDLESPIAFAEEVERVLADDGVWHLEQSYMPTMLRQNAYDTVCHEHLEYYSLTVIKYIVERVGMRIIDVSMNDINGGSFAVTVSKTGSMHKSNDVLINWVLNQEANLKLNMVVSYLKFAERVKSHKDAFSYMLNDFVRKGASIYGYGASTKGNVILQYCGITENEITAIAEINPDKYGAFTPKTLIPIQSEVEVKKLKPDFLVVFPWHFRNNILAKESEYINNGGKFIFPLPFIEVV